MSRAVSFAVFASMACAAAAAPVNAPSVARGAVADEMLPTTPVAGFDGHLFASYLYATTFFPDAGFTTWRELTLFQHGDPKGQVGVVVDHSDDLFVAPRVKVVVEANEFMGESELEVRLEADAVHRLFPKIDWNFEQLRALDEERIVTLKFRIELEGKPLRRQTLPVRLHPVHDCPYELHGLDRETLQGLPEDAERRLDLDQRFLFAAYVAERHPKIVDEIVPELTRQGFVRAITGYQARSADEVHRQVLSVWKLLRDRGVRYSSLGTLSPTSHVAWQHVRTIEQSLASAQANCVDGSVLMASILVAMGLDPFLVLRPGHCYLGFHLGPAKEDGTRDLSLLETTMLGSEVDPANVPTELLAQFRKIARGAGSDDASPHEEDPLIASYVAALLTGMQHWNEDQAAQQPPPVVDEGSGGETNEGAGEGGEGDDDGADAEGDSAALPPWTPPAGYAVLQIAELRARGLGSLRR